MSEPRRLPPALEAIVQRARGLRRWAVPPGDLVSAVTNLPEQSVTPPVERTIDAGDETPHDIRSAAAASVPGGLLEEMPTEAFLISRAFDGGEFAVAVHPPSGDGRWRFQGTVWLQVSSMGPALVSLVYADHVVASATLAAGGSFEFDEYLGVSWSIEIHLGDGSTLVITEPAR